MAEILYIRLGSEKQESIYWLITSAQGDEIIASGELKNAQQLIDLSEKSKNRQVIVFVPACDVALKSLYVPSKSSRAMKLAAPYMLEDELAQDVEKLFFAYHRITDVDNHTDESKGNIAVNNSNQAAANCFIAAVDQALMQQWLAWLDDADIVCKTMIPDALAMPLNEQNHLSAITLGSQVIVRRSIWQGFVFDQASWSIISQQWAIEDHDSENVDLLVIDAYSSLPDNAELLAGNTVNDRELTINVMPEELPLALLAQHSKQQTFNFLQV